MSNALDPCDPDPESLACLKKIYLDASQNLYRAPQIHASARKNYYIKLPKSSPDNWYNWLSSEQQKKAENVGAKSTLEYMEIIDKVKSMIKAYVSQTIYHKRMRQLYKDVLEKNGTYKKNIANFKAEVSTNDRKTYYEEQEISKLKNISSIILVIYWISFSVFCIISLFVAKKFKDYKVWILIILFALLPNFLIQFLIFIFYKLSRFLSGLSADLPKNVYANIKK